MDTLKRPEINAIIAQAFTQTNDAIGIFDPDDVVIYNNDAFAEIFGIDPAKIVGNSFVELITHCFNTKSGINVESDELAPWLKVALSKRRSSPFRSFETDTVDGRWYRITQLLVDDYLFMYATDITNSKNIEFELINTQKRLEELASTDFMTGIYNRRHFNRLAETELERCERNQLHASLVLIDIDFFKRINDKFGHAAGDAVLIELTQRIKSALRSYDIFARIGGEEFALLLPETTTDDAVKIAARYQEKISGTPFIFEKQQILVTASIGISESYPAIKTLDYILKSADENLYIAKQTGRNKIVCPPE